MFQPGKVGFDAVLASYQSPSSRSHLGPQIGIGQKTLDRRISLIFAARGQPPAVSRQDAPDNAYRGSDDGRPDR